MRLDGIHHITAITADAPGNVDFYTRVLGLRLVKKSVNQDDPTIYHLFYADDQARPGADLTFFEYPNAAPGRLGAGMVHTILWQVGGPEAIEFWATRLGREGVDVGRSVEGTRLSFADPEGLQHELVADPRSEPLSASAPDIPAEHALQGFYGARAYSLHPEHSRDFYTQVMGFEEVAADAADDAPQSLDFVMHGPARTSSFGLDRHTERGSFGRGAVHHIAWWSHAAEQDSWRQRVADAGLDPTPIIDRHYFRSVYFLEPSRVLFELATGQPGFDVDEDMDHLGERLSLPPKFEPLRDRLDQILTPLPTPATAARR